MISYQPKAEEIKALREETGAPMMDCRQALIDAAGDVAQAKTLLFERGASRAARKSERKADEGVIASYIHPGSKFGVLVEVNSETDFVARNPKFAELTREIAMQIAAMSPRYLDRESVPTTIVDELREEFRAGAGAGKPPEIAEKIVEGKLNKWFEEQCLLEQPYQRDDSISVADLINRAAGVLGENIRVRRFTRYALGE